MTSRERFEAYYKAEGWIPDDVDWQAWQAAERQALERAAEMFDALGKELAALQVRALIEQSAKEPR